MVIATPLKNAAHKLINTFGNSAKLWAIASATTVENDEGDISITAWHNSTAIKVVDGGQQGPDITQVNQGMEQIGEDEKIIRDDVTIALKDRLTYDGSNYKIVGIRTERVESTDIIQIIKVAETTDVTTSW